MSRLRIAVLAGGRSSEHGISLHSARSVIDALDPERFEAVAVCIDAAGGWRVVPDASHLLEAAEQGSLEGSAAALVPGAGSEALVQRAPGGELAGLGAVDVVFPVLHGPFGEDGTIQGMLETAGVPYVGAGVLGSALAMDKALCKAVLRDAGIPVARSLTLRHRSDAPDDPQVAARVEALGWPVFVKPSSLGSSVGISKVRGPDELPAALELAFRHDPKVLVEEFVDGREVECGVLGNERPIASAIAEIVPEADWYDYEAKYEPGGSRIVIPADIDPADARRIRETALAAFVACEGAGMARIDFFLRPDGALVLNEINTIPGFTETSVYTRLFAADGIPYGELLGRLVALALERHGRRAQYRY